MKLSLGTVQFGLHYGIANQSGQVSIAEAHELLIMARNQGIEDLDTAIAYGDAETKLGQIGVKGFRVVTKLPPMPGSMPDGVADAGAWAKSHLADSLKRLGSESIYGLMMHRSTDLLGPFAPALLKALRGFQEQGLVEKLGVSIYAPNELVEVMSLAQWGLIQAPFNLVDRRLYSSGWLRRLKDMGVEVHTRSTFLQGLLLTPPHLLPPKFAPWLQMWKSWYRWQEETSSTAVGACLAFAQSFPEVDKVVVGVDGVKHLDSIFATLNKPMNHNWPDIASEDERLVNPSKWDEL